MTTASPLTQTVRSSDNARVIVDRTHARPMVAATSGGHAVGPVEALLHERTRAMTSNRAITLETYGFRSMNPATPAPAPPETARANSPHKVRHVLLPGIRATDSPDCA